MPVHLPLFYWQKKRKSLDFFQLLHTPKVLYSQSDLLYKDVGLCVIWSKGEGQMAFCRKGLQHKAIEARTNKSTKVFRSSKWQSGHQRIKLKDLDNYGSPRIQKLFQTYLKKSVRFNTIYV